MSDMNRRRFLNFLLSLSSLSIFSVGYASAEQKSNQQAILLANRLLGGLKYKNSARKIGYEYLKVMPYEANINILLNHLCETSGEQEHTLKNASAEVIKTILRKKSGDDFRSEQVVSVRGWVLSKTEARLCALAVLV